MSFTVNNLNLASSPGGHVAASGQQQEPAAAASNRQPLESEKERAAEKGAESGPARAELGGEVRGQRRLAGGQCSPPRSLSQSPSPSTSPSSSTSASSLSSPQASTTSGSANNNNSGNGNGQAQAVQANRRELPPAEGGASAPGGELRAAQEQQPQQRFIHTSQLVGFVTRPVPRHKRVLCLIIRDKMSKLKRTKTAYFYPIYYLFIQAIVEVNSEQQQLVAEMDLEEEEELEANGEINSTFSASSSLSADMMFIGTNASGANAAAAATTTSASALGQQQSSTAPQLARMAAATGGTSYSDNEIYQEDELLPASQSATPDLLPAGSQSRAAPPAEQGKESPVFPSTASEERPPKANSKGNRWPTYTRAKASKHRGSSAGGDTDSEGDNEAELPSWSGGQPAGKLASALKGSSFGAGGGSGQRPATWAIADMFDNEQNPFTGTYGVVLAGRKRKKAKT